MTSTTAPQNRSDPRGAANDPKDTAAAYVARQADDARKAIAQTVTALKGNLLSGVDPRGWTKEHPWIAVGSAAVAGFVAAVALVPTKDDQALNRLKAIERALSMEPERRRAAADEDGDAGKEYAQGKHSFLTGLGKELLGAVKPLILSTLTAGVTAAAAKPSEEEIQAQAQSAVQNNPPEPPPYM